VVVVMQLTAHKLAFLTTPNTTEKFAIGFRKMLTSKIAILVKQTRTP